MALKTHATITDDIQDFLGQKTLDFTDALLTKWIPQGLHELSRYSPLKVRETLATDDDSLELNITSIKNLLWVDDLEYKISKTPREFAEFTEHYRQKLSMELGTKPSDSDSGIDTDEALDASETAVDVTPTAATAIPVGSIIRVENELMYVSVTGTTLTVVRGYLYSTATTHDTGKSIFLPELAYLYCAKSHKVPVITDLAGAVDLGAGYTKGVRTIHIDEMGASDLLEEDWTFTIATDGTGTVYRLTQDTTLSSNEGDITFEPGLGEDIADGDAVTFDNSTLTPRLETLLIDLVASRAAISIGPKFINKSNTDGQVVWRDWLSWAKELERTVIAKLEEEAKQYQKMRKVWSRAV